MTLLSFGPAYGIPMHLFREKSESYLRLNLFTTSLQ